MRAVLVTNCTNRKALAPVVHAANVRARTLAGYAREWQARIHRAPASLHARDLYLGRGFQEARRAWDEAKALGEADLLIASAGLGIVSANEKAPSYSITVSARGDDSVISRLNLKDAAEWWDQVTAGRRGLLARCTGADLIVVALSAPYLHMMRHELAAIAKAVPKRLRIIARNDPSHEEPILAPFWIAYDTRLNGRKSPYAGAESDFAQRALRHFVEHVLPGSLRASAGAHAGAVEDALAHMPRPRRKQRARLDDDQIIRMMRKIGLEVGASRMLRILRDEKHVACEQTRCSALFKAASGQVKAKRRAVEGAKPFRPKGAR